MGRVYLWANSPSKALAALKKSALMYQIRPQPRKNVCKELLN